MGIVEQRIYVMRSALAAGNRDGLVVLAYALRELAEFADVMASLECTLPMAKRVELWDALFQSLRLEQSEADNLN